MEKKIGIMVCHKVSHMCAGGGCFDAYNERKVAFEGYDDKVMLKGFFHCGGCDCDRESEDFLTKIQGLQKRGVSCIHMALCIEVECDAYETLYQYLMDKGFEVKKGTH